MSGLTKKHFKAIAEIINNIDLQEISSTEIKRKLIEDLSNYFATQNPLFNNNQFLKECLK
jgi:hypothetical protein